MGKDCVSSGTTEDDPVLSTQDFKGKSNVSMKAIPEQPPEGDVNGMGPKWRYNAKLVQGKHVPSTLNALASVLTMLMRKDSWTG